MTVRMKFTLPDGRTGVVESNSAEEARSLFINQVYPDMMKGGSSADHLPGEPPPSAPPAPAPRTGPTKEKLAADLEAARKEYDPAKGMNWLEKGAVGFQSGLRNAATGVGDLLGLASDEDIQERKDRAERNKSLGGWGTAGTIIGEGAATLPIGGPAGGVGAKVLTKAVPYLMKGKELGRTGLALTRAMGAGAAQGAAQEALVGKADDQGDLGARATEAFKGGAAGAATPVVLKAALAPARMVGQGLVAAKNVILPGKEAIQQRAYDALKKTIGEKAVLEAREAMDKATPPLFPQTSAEMSGSPLLGALERGARTRGHADFNKQDELAARLAWDALQPIPGHGSEAGDVLRGKFMREGIPQTRQIFGEGANAVPNIESHPLRQALGKLGPHLTDDERDVATKLSEELARRDLIKQGVGVITPDVAKWTDHIPTVLGSVINAKTVGMQNFILNRAKTAVFNDLRLSKHDKIMSEIDNALLDPQKFQTMVDEVRARVLDRQPLTRTQEVIKRIAEETTDMASRAAAAKAND